jgi:hypothetical protein
MLMQRGYHKGSTGFLRYKEKSMDSVPAEPVSGFRLYPGI